MLQKTDLITGVTGQRAHKDGIQIDNHSSEALDGVFWKVFLGHHEFGLNRRGGPAWPPYCVRPLWQP